MEKTEYAIELEEQLGAPKAKNDEATLILQRGQGTSYNSPNESLENTKTDSNNTKTEEWVPPDGGWAWSVAFGGSLIRFIVFGMMESSIGLHYLAIEDMFPDSPNSLRAWIPTFVFSFSLIFGKYYAY